MPIQNGISFNVFDYTCFHRKDKNETYSGKERISIHHNQGMQRKHRHKKDHHNESSWRYFRSQFDEDEVRKGYAHNNQ